MLMFQFNQACEEFIALRLRPVLELLMPPGQRTMLKLRYLAGRKDAFFRPCMSRLHGFQPLRVLRAPIIRRLLNRASQFPRFGDLL